MFKIRIKTVISENDMVGSSPYLFFRFAKSRFRSLDLKLRAKNYCVKNNSQSLLLYNFLPKISYQKLYTE